MPRELPSTLDPALLRRRAVHTGVQTPTRELSQRNEHRQQQTRNLWERYLVRAVSTLLPEGQRNGLVMTSDFGTFTNSASGENNGASQAPSVTGMFIDNETNNDANTDFFSTLLRTLQASHSDRHFYVVPAGLPLIQTGFQRYDAMEQNNNVAHISEVYQREGRPQIHEAGENGTDPEHVANAISRQVPYVGREAYTTLRKAVLRGAPVFSDRTTERLLVISSAEEIPGLEQANLTVDAFSQMEPPLEPTTNLIYFEGAQASGKTTQVKAIRNTLEAMGITVADPLPSETDPMLILKEAEAIGKLMEYGIRQAVVRNSLTERTRHARAQVGTVGVGDRSPNSAAMTSITTTRITEGSEREHAADPKITAHWLERNRELFDGLTVVLQMDDIYQSFFRMRKDPSTDNQQADLTTQFLEHVFYDTLIHLGKGVGIDVNDRRPEQVTADIMRLPAVQQIIRNVEERSSTREAIKEWWGSEDRVGAWFSTRLMKDLPDEKVKEEATKLMHKHPDMIYVGAAQNITRDDQERVIRLVKEARKDMQLNARDVKIVDFPSNPVHIAGNGDFAVVVKALNTANPGVDQDRVRTAVELLTERNAPYVVGGYVLFDNGSTEPPSVAETMNIQTPLSKPTWAKKYVTVASMGVDVLYFDRGSNPPAGPLSVDTVRTLVGYTDDLQDAHRPVLVIGGGVETIEQAKAILDVPGLNTVVYEEEPRTQTGKLHPRTLRTRAA